MDKNSGQTYSMLAEKGLQNYAENVTRRFELMDAVLQSVREANEYQAVHSVRARNEIAVPGRIEDELTEWKYELIQMKALLIQTLRELGVMDLLLDGIHLEFTRRIDAAKSAEECKALSEEMVRRFIGMNPDKRAGNYSMLVQKIMLAVEMDLSQSLTLQYFADSLSVNSSYLSNLFRKEVGMTITDYVTNHRILHAADLLLTSKQPVKTIAKQVGFADVQYFSRVFKKKLGKTPSQFRQERG